MRKAAYVFRPETGQREVLCQLCPHLCRIAPGQRGLCRARGNDAGQAYLASYGRVTAESLDPVEKKPLQRFYPGKMIYSLGSFGCNMSCGFCQNWRISQDQAPESKYLSPEDAVRKAIELIPAGNIGIAFTYSEPLVWFEYVLDTAKLAQEAGLKTVLVTNGYINQLPLQELLPYIDAVNLDIKSFSDKFYQEVCGAALKPVIKNARLIAEKCHLEVTTLLITELNDSDEEIEQLATFLASIDKDIPLHLSRYYPNYKFVLPATSLETMLRAGEIAQKHLNQVFLGNL